MPRQDGRTADGSRDGTPVLAVADRFHGDVTVRIEVTFDPLSGFRYCQPRIECRGLLFARAAERRRWEVDG